MRPAQSVFSRVSREGKDWLGRVFSRSSSQICSVGLSSGLRAGWHGSFYKGIAYKEGAGVTFWEGEKRAGKMFTDLFQQESLHIRGLVWRFQGFSKRLPGGTPSEGRACLSRPVFCSGQADPRQRLRPSGLLFMPTPTAPAAPMRA